MFAYEGKYKEKKYIETYGCYEVNQNLQTPQNIFKKKITKIKINTVLQKKKIKEKTEFNKLERGGG